MMIIPYGQTSGMGISLVTETRGAHVTLDTRDIRTPMTAIECRALAALLVAAAAELDAMNRRTVVKE